MLTTRPHILLFSAILSVVTTSISVDGAVPVGRHIAPLHPGSTRGTADGRRGRRAAGVGAGLSLPGPTPGDGGVFDVSSIFDTAGRRLARRGGDVPGGDGKRVLMDWTVEAVAADGTGSNGQLLRDRNNGISRQTAKASETVGIAVSDGSGIGAAGRDLVVNSEDNTRAAAATIIVISNGASTATTPAPTTVTPTVEVSLQF